MRIFIKVLEYLLVLLVAYFTAIFLAIPLSFIFAYIKEFITIVFFLYIAYLGFKAIDLLLREIFKDV